MHMLGILMGTGIGFTSTCVSRMIYRQIIRHFFVKADGQTNTWERTAKWILKYDRMVLFVIASIGLVVAGVHGLLLHRGYYG